MFGLPYVGGGRVEPSGVMLAAHTEELAEIDVGDVGKVGANALTDGKAVVVKPPECSQLSAGRLAELRVEAGMPGVGP